MKRSVLFSAIILWAGLLSCNKIDDPIKDTNGGNNPPPEETLQKILVEDYTGVKCKNCPDAAKKLKELEDAFGDRIVGIAVHGGFFSPSPGDPGWDPIWPVLHNSNSLDWKDFFEIAGWPIGMVNRYDYPPPGNLKSPGTWATVVNDHIDDEPKARIELSATYDTVLREVTINSDLSFLSTYVGTLKYQVCITEDKIIGAQLMPTNQIDPNYEHNHVLRACVNGSFGESIATDPLSGDTQSLTHKFKLETGWKDADCHVVTFIYDATTYEVIQAEKVSF